MAAILKNRYDVITPPPIFRSLRNLEDRCKITRQWLHICQNRNRPSFMTHIKRQKLISSTQGPFI